MGRRFIARGDAVNLLSLTCIQVSNAALPLLVFPVVLKVVGSGLYAKIALAEAIAMLAIPFVLYSFDVDGVSRIVGLRPGPDTDEISRVFSAVVYIRLGVFALFATAAIAAAQVLDPIVARLLMWWMLIPLSHVAQSFWLFQGLERNAPVAVFTAASRLACLAGVLLAVRSPADFERAPAIIGGFYLLGGVFSFVYAFTVLKVRLRLVSGEVLREYLRSGKEIFFGNVSVLLYRDVNVLILGAVAAGDRAVAAYSIAEKLAKSLQATMRPLNQLFFPKALRALRAHGAAGAAALRTMLRMTLPQWGALLLLLGILLFAYRLTITRIPALQEFPNRDMVASLVLIMSCSVFFGIANFMLGTVGLNYLDEKSYYFRSILAVGVLNAVLCVALAARFGGIGASVAFVFAEVALFVLVVARYGPINRTSVRRLIVRS